MMITIVATLYLLEVFIIALMLSASAKSNTAVCGTGLVAQKSLLQTIKKVFQNIYFEWGGGPDGGGGGYGPGGPGFYGGLGPGYGPFYGGGYSGPYGGGGHFGPYGPWVGGPGAGGYGQYNPYYGPNGYSPTSNGAEGHGTVPNVPQRHERYGFFERVIAFFDHWFG